MPEPGTMCPGVGKLTGYARILFDKQNDLPASGMDHSDLAHGMRQAAIREAQNPAETQGNVRVHNAPEGVHVPPYIGVQSTPAKSGEFRSV